MKIKYLVILLSFLVVNCSFNPSNSVIDPEITDLADPDEPSEVSTIDVSETVELPVLGIAPELNNQVWINTDHPLRLADLRGKVVLLEMWTYG
jgi:hypothetical protein